MTQETPNTSCSVPKPTVQPTPSKLTLFKKTIEKLTKDEAFVKNVKLVSKTLSVPPFLISIGYIVRHIEMYLSPGHPPAPFIISILFGLMGLVAFGIIIVPFIAFLVDILFVPLMDIVVKIIQTTKES